MTVEQFPSPPNVIYRVTTEGYDTRKPTIELGYATGNPVDIRAFYDDMKTRTIHLEKIVITPVTAETLEGKARLLAERNHILQRAREITDLLLEYHGEGNRDAAPPAAIALISEKVA